MRLLCYGKSLIWTFWSVNTIVTKFIFFYPFRIRFSWLPVVEDHDEAPHVYGYLCDLIQSNHAAVVGINNANLPRILQIIAEAFNTGVIEPKNEVGTRMLQIVQQLERNQELFKACYDMLTPEQGEALKDACLVLMSAPVP